MESGRSPHGKRILAKSARTMVAVACLIEVFALAGLGGAAAGSKTKIGQSGTSGASIALSNTPIGSPAGLNDSMRRTIEEERYAIRPKQANRCASSADAAPTFRASNRAQGFQTEFSAAGIRVSPLGEGAKRWEWTLRLTGFGYADAVRPVGPAEIRNSGEKIEFKRGAVTEWYTNDRRGLEQWFRVDAPPAAAGSGASPVLRFELAYAGDLTARRNDGRSALLFQDANGRTALGYEELRAWDRAGRDLPAHLELEGDRIALLVDAADAVYPITVDPLVLSEKKVVAPDGVADDYFGYSVSVDGDTAIVGALYDDDKGDGSGSAYVFYRDHGGAGNWGQVAKITAADGVAGDLFGWSVAISGDTAVVGAMLDDDNSTNSGSAYIFYRDQGGPDTWGQVAKITAADGAADDHFGHAVAISGDTAVVGAPWDDDQGGHSGSAYVFQLAPGTTDTWTQVQKLTASDGASGGVFGRSVTIEGDTAIVGAFVGAPGGSAYVYARNHGGADTWGQVTKLVASDGAGWDEVGWDVGLSSDTAIVTARDDDSQRGAAYVFQRSQVTTTTWTQVKKLVASDGVADDRFGVSGAIYGDTAIVGAYQDGFNAGSAYIYCRNAGGADNWGEIQKLTASDGAPGDEFGIAAALSGHTAFVTAPWDDARRGAAYVFEIDQEPPTPTPMTWGSPPAGTGPASISMTATTASDPNGVEYFFECTAGGGHDSVWQDSPTYVDTGLNEAALYTYRVRARDKTPYQTATEWSATASATTWDVTVPTPNPMTWASPPAATGPVSISMTATTASDPSGVEYSFECTAGGGHDSGWQDSPTFIDTNLNELTQYTYRVRARDKSSFHNATDWSTTAAATTLDGTPPTPDPMTWSIAPTATGLTSIAMAATFASDPSGVQYYFECTAGAGHDSGWQDSQAHVDTDLSEGETYTYRVRARDKSGRQNTTAWSAVATATTWDQTAPVPDPMTWASAPAGTGATSISMTATTASDPGGVEYSFQCTAGGGHNSGWQDSPTYVDTGLTELTTYTYRVCARDKSMLRNTTGWSPAASALTLDGTAPTPDPMTWASPPAATGPTSISMTASIASDPSGVEYYFQCVAGSGHDSGWQHSRTYVDEDLEKGFACTYRVRARDMSVNHNATDWSTAESATPSPSTAVDRQSWTLYR